MSYLEALMAAITENMTINDIIKKHPETMKVFNRHNVDSCCGGAQSVKAAAALGGVDLNRILAELNAAAHKRG